MEPTQKSKVNVKDFFLNLGAIISLYTVVISLINLLFTAINSAYPQIVNGYTYYSSSSIAWPVSTLIIFFPILILLMWTLEKEYKIEPDLQNKGIHKWLTYITLFISGLAIAGDLITVLYYFIDGQELTTGFLLKVLVLLVVVGGIFGYYISDLMNKLTSKSRMIWRVVSALVIIASIVWGFSVLGSPRTQRLVKYDEQRIIDLQTINSLVQNYYQLNQSIPDKMSDLTSLQYSNIPLDPETGIPYQYNLIGQSAKAYELCAEFDTDTNETKSRVPYMYADISWSHPMGHYCFKLAIPVNQYVKLPM